MAEKKYQQIFESLQAMILSGQIKPGDLLPSENELAKHFQVSRVTVRKSLSMLESKRIIHPHHGKGYFVDPPEHQRFTLIYNDQVKNMNCIIRSIMLEHPDPEIRHALHRGADEWVVYILRTIQNPKAEVLLCEQVYIPYRKGMPLVEEEIQYAEFPDLVKNKSSEFLLTTRMEIGLGTVDGTVAKYLGMEPGGSALTVYRYLIDENDQVAVFSKQYLHPRCGRIVAFSGTSEEERRALQ